ncbi:hypothetical protein IF651_02900 [Cellulosimicrobium arenosum]|uniref:UDP-N-acetylmuramyl pentapeptide phosphotransferase/UDP-N-acetylglucosamine-1-phosphate transferase n=1 Tax=Cellulosimicrobium arenosum TaxID=2708133 RepID=A0A927G798_9MICO|nr:hypothetical protein [Cellulosimicrobium arenosum]
MRALAGAALAGAVTVGTRRVLDGRPPGGTERWVRTNHRGEPISLLEGPSVAAGLAAGALVGGRDVRTRAAAALATVGAGTFGLVDDLAEDASTRTKGLRGHLGALAHGTVTTGGLKVLGIGGTSLVAAAVGTRRTGSALAHLVDVGVNGALVAGSANLMNLLDLRPGRALKAAVLVSAPWLVSSDGPTSAVVLGTVAAVAPGDLAERDMLGDSGANALGALVGAQVAFTAPRAARWLALLGVVGLTFASEKVSFSRVIEGNDVLRRVDSWGRRPREDDPGERA